jgi:hypothetical protein
MNVRTHVGIALMAGALVLAAMSRAHGARPRQSEPVISTIEFRTSPLMDLMMYVRTLAEQGDKAEVPDIEGLAGAVNVIAEIGEEAGGDWGVFSGPAHTCASAAEMIELAGQLPETFTMRSGQTLELRAIALKMANALAGAETAYLKDLWPTRKASLDAAAASLRAKFDPKQREVYSFIQDKLGTARPQSVIPVYLVADAPWPGAMTYMSRSGSMCFVGLTATTGSQLLESVIHETLHALDSSTRRAGNVFTQIEQGLREAGMERGDSRMRDVPHMAMFVQAAETVRRLLDPEHVDYGDTPAAGMAPYYERDAKVAAVVRPAWRAYLDVEITRDEAVKRIVAGVMGEGGE